MTRRDRLLRNTAFNGAGRVWDGVASLALVAYIVHRVGLADYGLWAVVAAFTGYAALFDIGLGSAYSRFIAEHAARREDEAISKVVSTGLAFYLVFGAAFVGVTWLLLDGAIFTAEHFGWMGTNGFAEAETVTELRFLIRWAIVLFAVSNCLAPFTAVQVGLQRMGVTTILGAIATGVKVAATVIFLEMGFGLRGLIFAQSTVLAAFGAMTIVAAFVVYPTLRLRTSHVSRETLSRLYRFGWRAQLARLANLVMFETDVIVIAVLLRSFELAGLYKIGVELANKMRSVPGVIVSAMIPAAADFHARGESETLRRLYLRATKYSAALAFPMAAFVVGVASPLLAAWVGAIPELTTAVLVLQIMAVGYVANIVPGAGVSIALGMGQAGVQMVAGLISMFANIVLTIALALTIGFWGIPLATVISMALSWAWFGRAMNSVVDVGWRDLWNEALRWPVVAGIVVGIISVIGVAVIGSIDGRVENGLVVAIIGAVAAGAYGVFVWRSPMFDAYDRSVVRDVIGQERNEGDSEWKQKRPAA